MEDYRNFSNSNIFWALTLFPYLKQSKCTIFVSYFFLLNKGIYVNSIFGIWFKNFMCISHQLHFSPFIFLTHFTHFPIPHCPPWGNHLYFCISGYFLFSFFLLIVKDFMYKRAHMVICLFCQTNLLSIMPCPQLLPTCLSHAWISIPTDFNIWVYDLVLLVSKLKCP